MKAVGSLTVAGLLAGCSGGSGDDDDDEPTETTGGSQLVGLRVANNDDEAHRLALQVERNDEVVSWTTHDLESRSAGEESVVTVSPDWAEEPASFVIEAQVDGDRHRQFAIEDGGCRSVFIEIDGEGTLRKYANDGSCEDGQTPSPPTNGSA